MVVIAASTNTTNSNKKPGMMPRDDVNCSKALLALQQSAPTLSVLQMALQSTVTLTDLTQMAVATTKPLYKRSSQDEVGQQAGPHGTPGVLLMFKPLL
jgi:hypothetical protein